MRFPYRIGQVAAVLNARRTPPDLAPALAVLPTELEPIFLAMPAEDQSHGLAALAALRAASETEPTLLQAALLHDSGKAQASVGIPHRSARVLLRALAPPAWRWLAGQPTGWRRPFWVVANHPARGAVWIESSGGAHAVAELVRLHEEPAPPEWTGTDMGRWHAALAAVDATL